MTEWKGKALSAVVMLLAISWAANYVLILLRPVVPVLIVVIVLAVLYRVLVRGRR